MKRFLGCLLALAIFDVPASEAGSVTKEASAPPEKCAVLFEQMPGKLEHQVLPSLQVQTLTPSATFALPADAPANVKAVQCGRLALVPKDTDYKVLAAGFPFAIVADGRVGILEMEEGRVRFRMLEGKMTEAETDSVQATLNSSQEHLNQISANNK